MKRKGLIVLAIVVIVVLGVYSWMKGSYNEMVRLNEEVQAQSSQIENQYQRRADLIPNLVSKVTEARAQASQTRIDINDAEALAKFDQAQGELSSALSRLMAISENYPDLKANQNFRDLQTQLEGTENRISVERRKFNETARQFNTYIKMFPRNILSNLYGFEPVSYFEAQQGAETAPKVEF